MRGACAIHVFFATMAAVLRAVGCVVLSGVPVKWVAALLQTARYVILELSADYVVLTSRQLTLYMKTR